MEPRGSLAANPVVERIASPIGSSREGLSISGTVSPERLLMRLRSVHIRGHEKLGNLDVDLTQGTGEIPRAFALIGGNYSGKSLVMDVVRRAWLSCWAGKTGIGSYGGGCTAQVNFEKAGEIFVVRYEGQFISNPGLGTRSDYDNRSNMMLWYGSERLGDGDWKSLGARNTGPLLMDKHSCIKPEVSNSIVLVDDFDAGLDVAAREKFYQALFEYHSGLGNQLVITSRECLPFVARTQTLAGCGTEWLLWLERDLGH